MYCIVALLLELKKLGVLLTKECFPDNILPFYMANSCLTYVQVLKTHLT